MLLHISSKETGKTNYGSELHKKNRDAHKEVEKVDAMKGQDTQYLYNAFRSPDGKEPHTDQLHRFLGGRNPRQLQYTQSYLQFTTTKSDLGLCSSVRKLEIRIFQQQPGAYMQMHTDFDNQRGNKLW